MKSLLFFLLEWSIVFSLCRSCFTTTTTNTSSSSTALSTVYIPIGDLFRENVTITSLSDFVRHAYSVDVEATVKVLVPEAGLEKASRQAQRAGCRAGINGGPFHADGSSLGVLVVNGKVQQRDEDNQASLVGFGRQDLPHASFWTLGAPPEPLESLQFYVTSFGWLVHNGVNVAPNSDNTGAKRAPRTAVGVRPNNELVFVVADGCEKW